VAVQRKGVFALFTIAYPIFERGRIMKKEMLLALRDYSFGLAQLQFSDLTNGIVAGCDISSIGTRLIIAPSIFKLGNFIYLMTEPHSIECKPTECTTVVKIRFSSSNVANDYIHYSGKIVLDSNINLAENEFEICRFKLKLGNNLRTKYTNFDDIQTEYDTVNLANATWSGIEESGIALPILRRFAKEALVCHLTDVWDISFCSQCMSQERVHKKVIMAYLLAKGVMVTDDMSNLDIYSNLALVLRQLHGKTRYTKTNDIKKPIIELG